MSTIHSLLENMIAAGTIYGWRLDAMLLGSILWAISAGYTQLHVATA